MKKVQTNASTCVVWSHSLLCELICCCCCIIFVYVCLSVPPPDAPTTLPPSTTPPLHPIPPDPTVQLSTHASDPTVTGSRGTVTPHASLQKKERKNPQHASLCSHFPLIFHISSSLCSHSCLNTFLKFAPLGF